MPNNVKTSYSIDFIFCKDIKKLSHKHLHTIDFKHAHISQLSDFIAIQQFHSSRAFVEVVAKRDAAVPALDFTRARP